MQNKISLSNVPACEAELVKKLLCVEQLFLDAQKEIFIYTNALQPELLSNHRPNLCDLIEKFCENSKCKVEIITDSPADDLDIVTNNLYRFRNSGLSLYKMIRDENLPYQDTLRIFVVTDKDSYCWKEKDTNDSAVNFNHSLNAERYRDLFKNIRDKACLAITF